MDKIRIVSYNSTGMASDKQEFLNEIILDNDPDIIFIQETWLINSKRNSVLRNINDMYMADGVSAVPDNELLKGRPYGGLGILWKKTMIDIVDFKAIPNTKRACAVVIKCGDEQLLCINMYMPVDNQRKTHVDQVFLDTLDCVEIFIQNSGITGVVMGGDMNLDFNRHNAHDMYYREIIDRQNLVYTFDLPIADKGYTYYDMSNGSKSCIDHFSVHNSLCDYVCSVKICDHALNPSKHLPLLLDICVNTTRRDIGADEDIHNGAAICWHRVDDNHVRLYQRKQQQILASMGDCDVAQCGDVNCCREDHRQQIDDWCEKLIDCCLKADDVLPHIRKQKRNRPYWREEVKPYKDESIWWHNLWVQGGKPSEGIIYDNMREAKRQLAYANRRNKRRGAIARKEKMAEAIVKNKARDFFQEVQKLDQKVKTAPNIDGHVDAKKIANSFADKFDELYNSVPPAVDKMEQINDFIQTNCRHCEDADRVVTTEDVSEAIKYLKSGKSDGNKGLISNHLLMSCEEVKEQLGKLITAINTHGYQPRDVLMGTIATIPKDSRGNICSGKNYRGITLCSSIAKVIDIVMLIRYSHLLNTTDMQYAFKKEHSTVMCTLVLKEVINYYLNNNSDVYTCFIDATKAFDRIRYDKLFQILIDRGLPALAVRSMLDLYQRQVVRTIWKGHLSRSFGTSNGIRQGGIISPILFCVYMDVLLKRLEAEGVGCQIGKHYYGALSYADDLTLSVPSIAGLRKMLEICGEYGEEFSVDYNPTKTVCMAFSRRKVDVKPNVQLCGITLKWVDNVKHLGNHLEYNLRETKEVTMKKSDLIQRVNTLLVTLGRSTDTIISKVFTSKCAHFYGAQAWNFKDKAIEYFQTAWNRCIRRLFNLPYETHRRYLPSLVGTSSAKHQIYSRFVKLESKMENSKNRRVSFLARLCRDSPRSIIGGNLKTIGNVLGVEISTIRNGAGGLLWQAYVSELSDSDQAAIMQIKELKEVLNGQCDIIGFSVEEVESMICDICVH